MRDLPRDGCGVQGIDALGGELIVRRPPTDGRPGPAFARRRASSVPSVGLTHVFTVATRTQLTSTGAELEFDALLA